MKVQKHAVAVVLLLVLVFGNLGAASEIKLTGRKDLVLSSETRLTVLEVAGRHLSEKGDSFVAEAAEADSPFSFDQPPEEVVSNREPGVVEPVVETVVNYDDASVLKVVASNFSKQVRGTLARGTTSYLQLKGGNMIKPGTSFPVSLPQAKGQTFKVTVTEITSNSYTLKLGDSVQTVSLLGSGNSSTNSIQLD